MDNKVDVELLKRFRNSTEPLPQNLLKGKFKQEPFDTV